MPKETCINGNIETSAGSYSSAKTKCDQSQVCCQYGGQVRRSSTGEKKYLLNMSCMYISGREGSGEIRRVPMGGANLRKDL